MKRIVYAFLIWLLAAPSIAGINNPGSGSGAGSSSRGQLTLNLGGAFNSGTAIEYPFRNYMKLWQPTYTDISAIDSNGYPKSGTLATDIQGQIVNTPTSQTGVGTQWVLKWTGKMGTGAVAGLVMLSATSVTSDVGSCVVGATTVNTNIGGTGCRVVFNFTGTPSVLTLKFLGGAVFDGTLSGLVLCRLSDEAAQDAAVASGDASGGSNPDLIAKIKTTPFAPAFLRTVNWFGINGGIFNNNVASSPDDLIPTTAVSYGVYWNIAKYAGVASGTSAYSVTYNGGALVEGLLASAKFTNASIVAPTFSIDGGSTFKPMLDQFGAALGAGGVSANSNRTLRYDAVLGGWISNGSSAHAGIPISVQVNLANQLNTGLWVNLPTYATDSLITSLATTVSSTLNGPAAYEYGLEMWNQSGSFPGTEWAQARGAVLGFPTAGIGTLQQTHDYYGLRVDQIARLINTVYGGAANCGPTKNCIVVLANQGIAASTSNTYRLLGTDLNPTNNSALCTFLGGTFSGTCSGAPNYSASPNRPVDLADAISWADYYNGAVTQAFDSSYTSTQSGKNVTAATNQNPTRLTIASHGYTTGNHVTAGSFTGGWTGANIGGTIATFIDANTISIPVDATGFGAYVSNGGVVARFKSDVTQLLAAADAFASSGSLANVCNGLTTPIAWMDCDINAGQNYGVVSSDTLSGLESAYNTPWETVVAGYDGTRPAGKSNLISALYEGGNQIVFPAAADCTAWGVSAAYCGSAGTIANLIGVGPSASGSSYKMSSAYQATAKAQWDQFFGHAHSKYGAKYTDYDNGQWGFGTGDIYQPTFTDYNAFGAYHFP